MEKSKQTKKRRQFFKTFFVFQKEREEDGSKQWCTSGECGSTEERSARGTDQQQGVRVPDLGTAGVARGGDVREGDGEWRQQRGDDAVRTGADGRGERGAVDRARPAAAGEGAAPGDLRGGPVDLRGVRGHLADGRPQGGDLLSFG